MRCGLIDRQVQVRKQQRQAAFIHVIRSWMADNFLKLNAGKAELIVIGNPKSVAQVQHF